MNVFTDVSSGCLKIFFLSLKITLLNQGNNLLELRYLSLLSIRRKAGEADAGTELVSGSPGAMCVPKLNTHPAHDRAARAQQGLVVPSQGWAGWRMKTPTA